MVSVENILVEFGGFTLLDEISFVINKRDRIALTGRNGAGKSTLLKIIAGVQVPTAGVISMPKDFTVGYLPQVLKITDTCSLQEEAAKAFDHIFCFATSSGSYATGIGRTRRLRIRIVSSTN